MSTKNSISRTTINSTTNYKDKNGIRLEFSVRKQAGQQVYYDSKGRRIGYVDANGRTMSQDNRILNGVPRPDLILGQLKRGE
jgi:hypothetical protein